MGFERGETDNRRAIYQAFLNNVYQTTSSRGTGSIGERATRQLPEITHRSPSGPVERRHPTSYESSKTIWIERGEREPLLRFDPLYVRTYTCARERHKEERRGEERRRRGKEERRGEGRGREKERRAPAHTFSHGNRQAIVVIKETDEGTKRRNKRVGWSRPAVYGALHLLAPYNPPRVSKRDLCGPTLRPTLHSIHYLLMVAALALGCPSPVSLSYMICRDERNLLLCNFSSPATSTRPEAQATGGWPSLARAIEIEIEIRIEVGWR